MPSPRRNRASKLALPKYEYYASYETEMDNLYNWSSGWANIIRNGLTEANGNVIPSGIEYDRMAKLVTYCNERLALFARSSEIPDFAEYIINETELNPVTTPPKIAAKQAEHDATVAALTACRDWLVANLPATIQDVKTTLQDGRIVYDQARADAVNAEPFAVLLDALNLTIEA